MRRGHWSPATRDRPHIRNVPALPPTTAARSTTTAAFVSAGSYGLVAALCPRSERTAQKQQTADQPSDMRITIYGWSTRRHAEPPSARLSARSLRSCPHPGLRFRHAVRTAPSRKSRQDADGRGRLHSAVYVIFYPDRTQSTNPSDHSIPRISLSSASAMNLYCLSLAVLTMILGMNDMSRSSESSR